MAEDQEVSQEIQEKEHRRRNIILYCVRHGDAEYFGPDDAEGSLTEKGEGQAAGAAKNLYDELPKEAVVEFISSDRTRAYQTAESIKKDLQNLIDVSTSNKKIIIHHEQQGIKTFQRLGMTDELTQEALTLSLDSEGKRQDSVIAWLQNPGQSVAEMQNNFQNVLRHMDRLSRHISPGPDLYIVGVTHTGPAEVFISKLLKQDPEGRLDNCEAFSITLPTDQENPILTFKGQSQEVSL